MNNENINDSTLEKWREEIFKPRCKRKYYLVRVFLIAFLNMLKIFKNGLREDLKEIIQGTYKNYFLLTKLLLGLISCNFIYKIFALGEHIPLSINATIDTLLSILTWLLLDVLLNPFKRLKFTLYAGLIIVVIWNYTSFLNSQAKELTNSLKQSYKENITGHKGNQQ